MYYIVLLAYMLIPLHVLSDHHDEEQAELPVYIYVPQCCEMVASSVSY